MATHGACGKSWTGMRAEHCPASGWRAFELRAHGDPGLEQAPVHGDGVHPEAPADAIAAEAGGVEPLGLGDVQPVPTLAMLGQVLLGGQDLQVGRVVVGGAAVDVMDVLTGLGTHDEAVFVDLDVLGVGDPTEAYVAAGADVASGRLTRRYLVGTELAYRLPVGAKAGSAAGVAAPTLRGGAGDRRAAVDADGVHALIVQWSCHETFNGTRAGDMHRVGDFNDGSRRCLTPEEMLGKGLVLNARGLWGRPGPEGPHPAAAARICGPDGQEWV